MSDESLLPDTKTLRGRRAALVNVAPWLRQVDPGVPAPSSTRRLSDILKERTQESQLQDLDNAMLESHKLELEARAVKAKAEMQEVKKVLSGQAQQTPSHTKELMEVLLMGEKLKESQGGSDAVTKTISAFTQLDQLKGGNNSNEVMLRLMDRMYEKENRAVESQAKVQSEFASRFSDLQNLLIKAVGDKYETELKGIREQMGQGGIHGFVKSLDDVKKLAELFKGDNQMTPEVFAATKQAENMIQLELANLHTKQRQWELERASNAEFQKGILQLGTSVAGPLITMAMEAAARKTMAAQVQAQQSQTPTPGPLGQSPALPPGPPGPPPLYIVPPDAAKTPQSPYGPRAAAIADSGPSPDVSQFAKPPGLKEWDLECGKCKNRFHCFDGSDAYVCEKCGTVHRPGPSGEPPGGSPPPGAPIV